MSLTHAQVKEEGKQCVLSHGPSNVLEFGAELIQQSTPFGAHDRQRVLAEAEIQARRVYVFLGYDEPGA